MERGATKWENGRSKTFRPPPQDRVIDVVPPTLFKGLKPFTRIKIGYRSEGTIQKYSINLEIKPKFTWPLLSISCTFSKHLVRESRWEKTHNL